MNAMRSYRRGDGLIFCSPVKARDGPGGDLAAAEHVRLTPTRRRAPASRDALGRPRRSLLGIGRNRTGANLLGCMLETIRRVGWHSCPRSAPGACTARRARGKRERGDHRAMEREVRPGGTIVTHMENRMTLTYAGIESHATPRAVLDHMTAMATWLARKGGHLHSGGAPGTDTAFANGAPS